MKKPISTLNDLIAALTRLRDNDPDLGIARVAVRTHSEEPVPLCGPFVRWWLADADDGELLEYGGGFESREAAEKDAEDLDKWCKEPLSERVVLLDAESV